MSAERSKSDGASPRIVLVLGGVRSGKSRYAQEFAERGPRVAFLATGQACDDEMRDRIARHRAERPAGWTTIEAPLALEDALAQCGDGQFDIIVIDCLTIWTANLMAHEASDSDRVLAHADRLAHLLRSVPASVVLVSNEVGGGIVPENEVARLYRDLLGGINQRIAAAADEVILMVAGCPLIIKQTAQPVGAAR
ncbi:MAG: bifunctional adenosylcobinamide kinase/adenosylcobinamide-phosphate guanylyltransferase [Candidatus Korobacteraceae bacterium]